MKQAASEAGSKEADEKQRKQDGQNIAKCSEELGIAMLTKKQMSEEDDHGDDQVRQVARRLADGRVDANGHVPWSRRCQAQVPMGA